MFPHSFAIFSDSVKHTAREDGAQPAERGTSEVMKDMSAALSTNQMQLQRGIAGYTPLRQLTDIWLKSPTKSDYIRKGKKLERAVTRILNIKPPQFFTRLPRTLDDRGMWKASEWK
ncbi:hypothetical protein HPB48_023412 [Haemaphysalis longicornis]|uniref:Uncharacterized protein n=1 Tax=Haemaphysalis longicornis TaxID=44386 RepID=A0A9J6H5A5_HAELO|nr:hypothetical protein HPB48_023412 [Haemaphysalis longicornis]